MRPPLAASTAALLAVLLLHLPAAHAAGVNLRWNTCYGDGGVQDKNFACDTNLGTNVVVGSFLMDTDLLTVSGTVVIIDIASAGAVLPAWWEMKNPGTCRQLAISYSVNTPGGNCPDWAAAQGEGGLGQYLIGQRGPNTARIGAVSAVPPYALQDLFGGQEYYAFSLGVSNIKTVGTGACAGCQTGVCIVFNSILLNTPILANDRTLSGPSNGTDSNYCMWQGGGNPTVGVITGCPAATPTKQRTWGAVKALYR